MKAATVQFHFSITFIKSRNYPISLNVLNVKKSKKIAICGTELIPLSQIAIRIVNSRVRKLVVLS